MQTYESPQLSSPSAPVAPPAADAQFATRIALLEAAERLFSENGVEGTSIRDIIKAAGANLGAINYHFGTKDRLALEVFARRIQPVNRDRIARLDALEKSVGPDKITLEQILDALVRPVMEGDGYDVKSCENLMRLISRSFQEPNPEVKKFVEEQFAEVVRRFDSAILRVVPSLPQGELFWRMCFLHGALHQGMAKWLLFDQLPNVVLNPAATKPSREALIQSLIAFMAAGISAPLPRPHPAPTL